ncbi:WD40 repeat-like protein [Westerdykella ornata]|uniref:WD40 repeat-like protein n=1 Tax=Westerdykella ornata TaxID=318751 RepID=A0A6A6JX70_WESOR|nr:WD40 repeat-like protein [Westerdykella ornata]KAF2281007.1 WD40 repeat-like protein [Westerdykella ornata]
MSTAHLLARSVGIVSPDHVLRNTTTRLIYALQPTPITFSYRASSKDEPNETIPAHISGVNALTIDKFEGRYLLSGGADSSIAIWDLENPISSVTSQDATPNNRYLPLSSVRKTSEEHKLGITQICFYPFDSLAFLTSSYDHTVKIYSSETLQPSASFDLDSVVYNIALSPIADHLLVACATQHQAVRLIDLRSGANTHSLPGHAGAVLATAWSPTRDHVLASGATDGSVRFWDIRRSSAELGVLDLEDTVGILGRHSSSSSSFQHSARPQAKAHRGAVNGLLWTEDAHYLITCGHDSRIRVWDTDTGANTLVNFGPMVRNASGLAPCIPVLPPARFMPAGGEVIFFPNGGGEILGFELFEGRLVRRLRRMAGGERDAGAAAVAGASSSKTPRRNVADRVTALAWRAHDVEMYSSHADGSIAVWKPRTEEDAEADEEEEQERAERDEEGRKRKRDVLEDIYLDLTRKKVTFGGV